MSQHTPGPWHRNLGSVSAKLSNGATVIVARCPLEAGLPQRNCNARLIAAAPDLLAACKEMVAGLLGTASLGLNEEEVTRLKRAEAAVAKAEQ